MTETKINVVKQWAINAKSFSVVEVIEELQKENAELKIDIEIADSQRQLAEKENADLKAQVEQLSNDNYVLKTSFIIQQEQIEKMKCCANCINGLYNGQGCFIGFKCENKNKWEFLK